MYAVPIFEHAISVSCCFLLIAFLHTGLQRARANNLYTQPVFGLCGSQFPFKQRTANQEDGLRSWVTWHAKGVASWGLKTRHIFSCITPRNTTFPWISVRWVWRWMALTSILLNPQEFRIYIRNFICKKKKLDMFNMCVCFKDFFSVLVNQIL
jgi:hypothetical protein